MGLIEWLRGERGKPPEDVQEERTAPAQDEFVASPETPASLDDRIEAEHDEEAVRHRGM
jgi:hypothetical protein